MPVTIKSSLIKYKNASSGEYESIDAITQGTTDEMVAEITNTAQAKLSEINTAGTTNVTAIENKGEEVLESIPSDYTNLNNEVSDLKSAINGGTFTFTKTYMSDNRYSTNRIYNAEETNIGKKLSDIYYATTTNAFAYMLDVTLSKLVKLPVGTQTTTSNYGCLAFDENDVCVWTRRYTAGDVAGNTVDVVLPENAVKMLCVFGNSLNSSGIEYVLTLERNNALNEIGENILHINKIQDFIDYYASEPNTFHVNANATHSSTSNKTFIDISNGTKFAIVYNRHYSNLIQFYGYDSSNNGTSLFNSYQKSGYAIITAPTDIKSIGMTVIATANADDYSFVIVTEEQELFRLLQDLSEAAKKADSAISSIGDIYRKSFSVNANSTHDSSSDRMSVAIPASTPFVLGFDVTSANNTALAMLYAVKEDDTTANFKNIYPGLTVNKLYTVTLDYAVKAIGVYYSNTVSEAVTVSTLVAVGQLDTNAIYDNQHDVLFVDGLNSDMTHTLFEKYADTNDAETFVFFSDPHYLLNNGGMTTSRINLLDCEWLRQLKTKADAINAQAVICGGDLINSEQTDAELCYKLGMHHAIARKLFGDKYHLALGNHDTRFDNTSQSVLDNLLFAEEDTQKAYFTVKTPKTKYYFLNTGTDQNGAMTSYRWEQIAWLADKLLADTETNRAISMHIFSNDASGDPANFGNGITPMATNVVNLVNAYNSKGTVTLNGITYNFATATGKIRFILCGHTHYDTVYTATGDIPVICIDDATAIGTATKLTMYSCLADYENGKLYACRGGATTVEVTLA